MTFAKMAEKKKILIVEDEFYLAETIKARLEYQGYEVLYAENGAEALKLLASTPVDLVLMDVMMPVMDGWEATRRIKADPKLKALPVIFLTARAQHEDHIKAHEVGGDDYLSKPFESEELLDIIKKWIEKTSK